MNTHKSDLIHVGVIKDVIDALLLARPEWSEPLTAVAVALGVNPPAKQERRALVIEMGGREGLTGTPARAYNGGVVDVGIKAQSG